ncbi:MAG: hypothetical protein V4503_07335 [Gemmatimonadota bacterium]
MVSSTNATMMDDAAARREGVITGLFGAAVVAVFYLGVDVARGQPLMTPTVLGEVFVMRQAALSTGTPDTMAIVLYTIVHIIAFTAFGIFLTALARRAEQSGLMRYAIVQLLVVFELFFYGLLQVGAESARGMFPLWSVLAANTLAAIVMCSYLWRRHPALARAFAGGALGKAEGVTRRARRGARIIDHHPSPITHHPSIIDPAISPRA